LNTPFYDHEQQSRPVHTQHAAQYRNKVQFVWFDNTNLDYVLKIIFILNLEPKYT